MNDRYKWIALSNTTLAVLLATLDVSITLIAGGIVCLLAFVAIERRASEPMFRLPLFRIRAFTFGTLSTFLSAVARGGLMFILIIWLQGIWLPQHGYDFATTPLWAGIYMLPLTIGMLLAGPLSGYLSDRYGARPFASGGMLGAAASFALLLLLPTNFPYLAFALAGRGRPHLCVESGR